MGDGVGLLGQLQGLVPAKVSLSLSLSLSSRRAGTAVIIPAPTAGPPSAAPSGPTSPSASVGSSHCHKGQLEIRQPPQAACHQGVVAPRLGCSSLQSLRQQLLRLGQPALLLQGEGQVLLGLRGAGVLQALQTRRQRWDGIQRDVDDDASEQSLLVVPLSLLL